jgi:hypothetical protein
MHRSLLISALVALALVPAADAAAPKTPKNLWATVNICDTAKHPDKFGVRARMPGDGTHERMFMRFTAQFRGSSGWVRVKGGRTGWLKAGSAFFVHQETGFTFPINVPKGASFTMRGVVDFQWRRRRKHGSGFKVVRHAHRVTQGGHGSDLSDPAGFSAARCVVRG